MSSEEFLNKLGVFEDPFSDTYEIIQERLFGYLADLYPEEGSRPTLRSPAPAWTLFSAAAYEFAENTEKLNEVLSLAFVQSSRGVYLDYRGTEVNLPRNLATSSSGTLRFMGDNATIIPIGTLASTETTSPNDPVWSFESYPQGTIVALPDPVTAPTVALTDAGTGVLAGDTVYKFVYVTALNTFENSRGYTLASPTSAVVTAAAHNVNVTVPTFASQHPSWVTTNPDLAVVKVIVYRSYRLPGIDTDYSEFTNVYEITTTPTAPALFKDDLTDPEFFLVDSGAEGVGGLPGNNTTGTVTVLALGVETGAGSAVAAGAVRLLDSDVPGVEAVTNPAAMSGGSNDETDTAYAVRLLEKAQQAPGAGNIASYIVWAREVDGVGGVAVVALWDGPGTVQVIISNAAGAVPSAELIESVRQYICGTSAVLDPSAAITGHSVSASGGSIAAGTYYYVYTYTNTAGETRISPSREVVVASGSANTVTLVDIPYRVSGVGPATITDVKVYRKAGLSGTYRQVAVVPNTESPPASGFLADVIDTASTASIAAARKAPANNSTSLFDGKAPVGAHVMVQGITSATVSVDATVWVEEGYTASGEVNKTDVGASIEAALSTYLASISAGGIIRITKIQNAIHDVVGVRDFSGVAVTVNGGAPVSTNVTLASTEVATLDAPGSVFTEGA